MPALPGPPAYRRAQLSARQVPAAPAGSPHRRAPQNPSQRKPSHLAEPARARTQERANSRCPPPSRSTRGSPRLLSRHSLAQENHDAIASWSAVVPSASSQHRPSLDDMGIGNVLYRLTADSKASPRSSL